MTSLCWGFPLRDKAVVAEDLALANIYLALEMTEGTTTQPIEHRDLSRTGTRRNIRSTKRGQAACSYPGGILTLPCYGMNRQSNDEGSVCTAVFADGTHTNARQYSVSNGIIPRQGSTLEQICFARTEPCAR
jgi:hypothetical protein